MVNTILGAFCYYYGCIVNKSKSQVFFSSNMLSSAVEEVCQIVGFNLVVDLGVYLGIPILYDNVTVDTFDFVVNKIQKKLFGWQVRKLLMAGRITLVRSVLLAKPNYFMYTARIPISVCNEIERIARNFIWGTIVEARKTTLVSWKDCCRLLEVGGLGLRCLAY